MKPHSKTITAFAALGLVAGSLALSAQAANAGPIRATASYNGACGSGYSVIDTHGLSGATIFLTYNSSKQNNCVVTVRNTSGSAKPMFAEVSLAGASWNKDEGNYTSYAGPVSVHAPGRCIDWGGGYNGSSWAAYSVHCG